MRWTCTVFPEKLSAGNDGTSLFMNVRRSGWGGYSHQLSSLVTATPTVLFVPVVPHEAPFTVSGFWKIDWAPISIHYVHTIRDGGC